MRRHYLKKKIFTVRLLACNVQSDTLLLVDIFEKFINMCIKRCELDLSKIFSAPKSAW